MPSPSDKFLVVAEVARQAAPDGHPDRLGRAVVVEKHGGTLRFETEMGKGTTFFVRLPLAETLEAQEGTAR